MRQSDQGEEDEDAAAGEYNAETARGLGSQERQDQETDAEPAGEVIKRLRCLNVLHNDAAVQVGKSAVVNGTEVRATRPQARSELPAEATPSSC